MLQYIYFVRTFFKFYKTEWLIEISEYSFLELDTLKYHGLTGELIQSIGKLFPKFEYQTSYQFGFNNTLQHAIIIEELPEALRSAINQKIMEVSHYLNLGLDENFDLGKGFFKINRWFTEIL